MMRSVALFFAWDSMMGRSDARAARGLSPSRHRVFTCAFLDEARVLGMLRSALRPRVGAAVLLRACAARGASALAPDGRESPSVDAAELRRFAAHASRWWAPDGPYAGLHAMNAVRVPLVLRAADIAAGGDGGGGGGGGGASPGPLQRVVDIGCGGGLLSEALARHGRFSVLGIDAEESAVRAARAHAALDARLAPRLEYACTTAEALGAGAGAGGFDVVVASEVLEHVREPAAFVAAAAALARPGGALLLTTLDRSVAAFALAVLAAEYVVRLVPAGTHDWTKFVRPDEAAAMLTAAGVAEVARTGLHFSPLTGAWRVTRSTAVNYAIIGRKVR